MNSLVIRVAGTVQENNIKEFESSAMELLNSINTELVTDDDFADAEQAIKDCTTVETRIAAAKQQAMHDMEEVSKLFDIVDQLSDRFRTTRLGLEKKVKSEKERRKYDIVKRYTDKLKQTISAYPCSNAFDLRSVEFNSCVKGKRSITEMEKACAASYNEHLDHLGDAIVTWGENIAAIEDANHEYPGLFPDKKQLCISSVDIVAKEIESRILKHQLAMKEKEEAARLKAEREEAAIIEAARIHKEREEAAHLENHEQEEELPEFPATTDADLPPVPEFEDIPELPAAEERRIIITFYGSDAEATKLASVLYKLPGVITAVVEETEEAF